MKRTITMLALAALLTGTSHAAISGKKPAFMDKQQLAVMRAEASSNTIKDTENSAFFTGKPYLTSSDGYAFKYRSYSPGIARWTSEDPSGFPDGANGSNFAPVPTSQFDFEGLASQDINITIEWETLLGFDQTAEWGGIAKWSFVKNEETAEVDPTPGFTGDLPVGNFVFNGVNIGGAFDEEVIVKSDCSYKTVNGVQWNRWTVELRVDIYLSGLSGRQLAKTGPKIVIVGEWYE